MPSAASKIAGRSKSNKLLFAFPQEVVSQNFMMFQVLEKSRDSKEGEAKETVGRIFILPIPAQLAVASKMEYEQKGLGAIGALAANLFGQTIISFGELFLGRMPIVRNVHRALKQIFESVVSASESGFMDGNANSPHRVGLVEFPSKGIWSIVYVTGEASGAIRDAQPGGETDLVAAFMPTGMVPPTGFVCFIPRRNVIFLPISMEDAAKTVVSAGMYMPEQQEHIKAMLRQANASLNATD